MATQRIIYGTAWKKEATSVLVVSAVLNGFRAIDTACQPKHYREDLVGAALQTLYDKHGFKREDLYIQTKYTPIGGHDQSKPLPYDPSTSVETQVTASFHKSLENLKTDYLDCLLLHSPLDTISETVTAWKTLIALQDAGKVKKIGISKCYTEGVLESLREQGGRGVQVVQNRWHGGNKWDKSVWSHCRKNNIQYQSFWTLTGSPKLLNHPTLLDIAARFRVTPEQVVYKIAQLRGVTPLSGTTQEKHMKEDLAVENIAFDDETLEDITEITSEFMHLD